jgi:hypothetical protein
METVTASSRDLILWTVTTYPSDYPTVPYVVRANNITTRTDGGVVGLASSLTEARQRIADLGGTYNLGRDPADPPVIVETWT